MKKIIRVTKGIVRVLKFKPAHAGVATRGKWDGIKWELYLRGLKEEFRWAERKLWKQFAKEGVAGEKKWGYYHTHGVEEKVKMILRELRVF